jgi:glutamate N-acetyltransferase / amino-acid N-acetyltransferase
VSSAFFRSRWVPQPPHVRQAETPGLPRGFRSAGVAAGIKPSGGRDVGLLVCDAEDAVSAAVFTRSGVLAAPVLATQEIGDLERLRAVAANSGNANAATGPDGMEVALATQAAAAEMLGLSVANVAVASTGVIGVPLDVAKVTGGLHQAHAELGADAGDFQQAIMTTDLFAKQAELEVDLPSGTVRLTAQCKGAGMISPAFATMLCFVQTDAALAPETAKLLLSVCVKRSFDLVSVDGQLSTNDTAILMASGASGVVVAPESEDELRFGEALDALLRQLAIDLCRDGEGARRVGRITVHGGDARGVPNVARAIANSPLVKTALYGGDPNWGRIAQAVGMAVPHSAPLPLDIEIEGVTVCAMGAAVPHDEAALAAAVSGPEVDYVVGLPGEGEEAQVWFSDLGHEYVTINAEYTT